MISSIRMHRTAALVLAGALAGVAGEAQAINLVTNGDFETGDLSGWSTTGPLDFVGADSFAAHSGDYGAFFGPDSPVTLSQSVATTPGSAYEVSFWLALQDSAQPNSFSWTWDGVMQPVTFDNSAAFDYREFTALLPASGGSSTLSFTFTNPQSFWLMDDVSVAAVPEPGIVWMMGIGMLCVAMLRKRRTL